MKIIYFPAREIKVSCMTYNVELFNLWGSIQQLINLCFLHLGHSQNKGYHICTSRGLDFLTLHPRKVSPENSDIIQNNPQCNLLSAHLFQPLHLKSQGFAFVVSKILTQQRNRLCIQPPTWAQEQIIKQFSWTQRCLCQSVSHNESTCRWYDFRSSRRSFHNPSLSTHSFLWISL